jgi:[protein-PII] uridylyltransferase
VWTEVKARFLHELFERTEAVLTAETSEASEAAAEPSRPDAAAATPTPAGGPDVQAYRERVRRQLGRDNKLPAEAIHEHTVAMPAAYLLNTSLDDMLLHIAMVARVRDAFRPIIDSRTPYGSSHTELTVVAYDDPRPGLLAKIAAVLYAHDVNLHAAQVFTRSSSDRIAIDSLWVDYRDRPLSPAKRREVEDGLREVLTGRLSVPALLTRRGKPTETIQPVRSLVLDGHTSSVYSILDVLSPDVKGVVYRVTAALSSIGWNIHSARLSTWSGNARLAFYLTDMNNNKIPAAAVSQLNALLPRDETTASAGHRTATRSAGAPPPLLLLPGDDVAGHACRLSNLVRPVRSGALAGSGVRLDRAPPPGRTCSPARRF